MRPLRSMTLIVRVIATLGIVVAAAVAAGAPAARAGVAEASTPAAQPSAEEASAIEEVQVSGERSGPNLWRISKGDHVAWILGTYNPLPKKMTWRSREVESVLAEAQEVLPSGPKVTVDAGFFTKIRVYLQYRRIMKLPDEVTLKDWLSAGLYARFTALKLRFDAGDKRIEELQPMFAALRLYTRVLDESQLTPRNDIEAAVLKLARKHQVKIRQTLLTVDDPRGLVAELGEIPRAAQISCLDAIVGRLETDLETMKAGARAWALGDVDALRALPDPKELDVCTSAASSSRKVNDLIDSATRRWNAALESALATNRTTLAMKPIHDLLGPDGTLASLRAKGYQVEGP